MDFTVKAGKVAEFHSFNIFTFFPELFNIFHFSRSFPHLRHFRTFSDANNRPFASFLEFFRRFLSLLMFGLSTKPTVSTRTARALVRSCDMLTFALNNIQLFDSKLYKPNRAIRHANKVQAAGERLVNVAATETELAAHLVKVFALSTHMSLTITCVRVLIHTECIIIYIFAVWTKSRGITCHVPVTRYRSCANVSCSILCTAILLSECLLYWSAANVYVGEILIGELEILRQAMRYHEGKSVTRSYHGSNWEPSWLECGSRGSSCSD